MSQDEFRSEALPGQLGFEPPPSLNGSRLNGSGPQPRDTVDIWDQRVAKGLAFLRRRLAGEAVEQGGSGLSKREWAELEQAIGSA